MYAVYPGGCYSSPLKNKFPLSAEAIPKDLKFEVSGVRGLNGVSVDLYSYSDEQGTRRGLPNVTTTTTLLSLLLTIINTDNNNNNNINNVMIMTTTTTTTTTTATTTMMMMLMLVVVMMMMTMTTIGDR